MPLGRRIGKKVYCKLPLNLSFPFLSRSREQDLRQKESKVNLRARDIVWVIDLLFP